MILEGIGERHHEFRREMMQACQEGLTRTYKRFHYPSETATPIAELRRPHIEMDQAIGAAHSWQNLDLGHGFHDTTQGIRYTISEAARGKVFDCLMALNDQRHAEQEAGGQHTLAQPISAAAKRKAGREI